MTRWPSLVCPSCGVLVSVDEGGGRCPGCGADYPLEDGILRLASVPVGARAYDPHYFETLPLVEEHHFWFVARREMVLAALRRAVPDLATRPLFDVGCGSGGLLKFLEAKGVPVGGACDAYPEALRIARSRCSAPLVLVDEGRDPPLGPGQRLVGLFDVLEHLDDDVGTLSWLASVLEPGGVLALTVPAHPALFDEADVLARHRRRYRRAELAGKLQGAGFEIRTLTHFMALLAPALFVGRRIRRLVGVGGSTAAARRDAELRVVPGLNGVLLALLRLECLLARRLPLPFGTSLLAIATRSTGRSGR